MRPPQIDQRTTRTGTLSPQETIRMSIDVDSLDFVMQQLTDLYANPLAATIREPYTNARDSHIAAGKAGVPVQVFLPSELNPTYVVKDFGTGMSPDDIRSIYAVYAKSTKRGNDDETGMLGFGSKAPLTLVSSFTVIAVKNSVKTTAVISRDESNVGQIEIVSTVATDEYDGVEVRIPVPNVARFNHAARDFFSYSMDREVLVDGKFPEPIDGVWISDDVVIRSRDEHDDDVIVMGGVPYAVTSKNISQRYSVVAWVPMGAIAFPPSREYVYLNSLSEETLAELKDYVQSNLHEKLLQRIEAAETYVEAWDRFAAARRFDPQIPSATYRGQRIPQLVEFESFDWSTGRSRGGFTHQTRHAVQSLRKAIHVVGFTSASLTPTSRRKLSLYMSENDLSTGVYQTALFYSEPMDEDTARWVGNVRTVAWEDVAAMKLPKSSGTGRRNVIKALDEYGRMMETDLDEIDLPILFFKRGEQAHSYKEGLTGLLTTHAILQVSEVSWNRLRRDYGAEHVDEYVRRLGRILGMSVTRDVMANLLTQAIHGDNFAAMDPDSVLDPDLRDVISRVKVVQEFRKTPAFAPYKSLYKAQPFRRLLDAGIRDAATDRKIEDPGHSDLAALVHRLTRTYPLVSNLNYRSDALSYDHAITYVNAIFKEASA